MALVRAITCHSSSATGEPIHPDILDHCRHPLALSISITPRSPSSAKFNDSILLVDTTEIIANIEFFLLSTNSNFNFFDVTSHPPLKSTTNAATSRIPTYPKKCPTTLVCPTTLDLIWSWPPARGPGEERFPRGGKKGERREKKERRVQRHGKKIERRGPYPHAPDGVQSKKKKQHGERLPPPWRRFS